MSDIEIKNEDARNLASSVPNLYVNGIEQTLTTSDVAWKLLQNGIPIALLNMSFTTAKTVYLHLGQLMSAMEEATGQTIMPADIIAAGIETMRAERVKKEGEDNG